LDFKDIFHQDMWLTPVILATSKAEIGRITVQAQPTQTACETPISKINMAKWTGGVGEAVECLLCKCKVLCSTSVP
jgi:hypothetical protein